MSAATKHVIYKAPLQRQHQGVEAAWHPTARALAKVTSVSHLLPFHPSGSSSSPFTVKSPSAQCPPITPHLGFRGLCGPALVDLPGCISLSSSFSHAPAPLTTGPLHLLLPLLTLPALLT